jgi:hypothetical protein
MPSLKFAVPHELGQKEATARIQGFMVKIKDRYQNQVSNLVEQWTDNVLNFGFKTFGFDVKGKMTVEPDDVQFEGQLPMAAIMFKGKIEQTVREEMNRLLA